MSPDAPSPSRLSEAWLDELRQRFVAVARRRASEDDVEDLVQEALGIVATKGPDEAARGGRSTPRMDWCFQVLRNVLGNHYQRRRTRAGEESDAELSRLPGGETPFEALHRRQVEQLLRDSLQSLDASQDPCGPMLARVLDGDAPADMAASAGVEPAVFYRRLYRCRQKLRRMLEEKGVIA